MGYVYFFQVVGQDLCKIGKTRNKLRKRFSAISSSCPLKLRIAGFIEANNYSDIETELHGRLHAKRQITSNENRSEWFNITDNDILSIVRHYNGTFFKLTETKLELSQNQDQALKPMNKLPHPLEYNPLKDKDAMFHLIVYLIIALPTKLYFENTRIDIDTIIALQILPMISGWYAIIKITYCFFTRVILKNYAR